MAESDSARGFRNLCNQPGPVSVSVGEQRGTPFRICLISLFNGIAPGLRVISSVLKERGHHVDVVFLHGNVSTVNHPQPVTSAEHELLAGLCRDLQPDVIGIGITSSFLHSLARDVSASVRRLVAAPILWGGSHVTIAPERCIDHADYLCVGEGEATVLALADCLRAGDPVAMRRVPGLAYRMGGAVQWNSRRAPVSDLDTLPFQDIDETDKYLVECGRLVRLDPIRVRSTYPTYASRGCPFNCTFCSRDLINEASGLTRAPRCRSPEHIIDELEVARHHCANMRSVRFWDDTFPMRASWLREFSRLYRDRVGLPFEVWLHPKSARGEALRLLRDAGLASVGIGIESGSQRVRRDVFGRPETQDDIVAASRALHECGVERVTYDLILEHEYERDVDKVETFELLLSLEQPFALNMHGLSYLPKTALAERALKDGVVTPADLEFVFEAGVEANMLRHRWIKGPHLDSSDARGLVWPRLNFLTQYSFLPRNTLRRLAAWTVSSRNIEMLVIRIVDLLWGGQEWRPELEYPDLVQRVRLARLEPFLHAHPSLVTAGRLGLAVSRRFQRGLARFLPGPREAL